MRESSVGKRAEGRKSHQIFVASSTIPVLMIVLIEMALITPPVGLNLYVVQGARKSGHLNEVMLGTIPYVLVMLAMAGALIAFPQIALFLPAALN